MQPSFTMSLTSTAAGTSRNSTNIKIEERVSVPGVGIAYKLPNDLVKVEYTDGSNLQYGKHNIQYQYPDGHIVNYLDNENIPKHIMDKFVLMPMVLKHLKLAPRTQKYHNIR